MFSFAPAEWLFLEENHRIRRDIAEQIGVAKNKKSGHKPIELEVGQHSTADLRSWQEAVFQHARRASGKTYEDSDYSVRIQHEGRRARFALGTPNRAAEGIVKFAVSGRNEAGGACHFPRIN